MRGGGETREEKGEEGGKREEGNTKFYLVLGDCGYGHCRLVPGVCALTVVGPEMAA